MARIRRKHTRRMYILGQPQAGEGGQQVFWEVGLDLTPVLDPNPVPGPVPGCSDLRYQFWYADLNSPLGNGGVFLWVRKSDCP